MSVNIQNSNFKRKYYLIDVFTSSEVFEIVFLAAIFKAVCEDDKNTTSSKNISLWRVWDQCHFSP